MVLLGRAPHRVAMAVANAMPLIDEIEMRVDLHDMWIRAMRSAKRRECRGC